MRAGPGGLHAFVTAVFAAGVAVSAWAWTRVPVTAAVAFAAVAAATELLPARLRDGVSVSLVSVVVLTAVLVGGPGLAVCATTGLALVVWRDAAPGRRAKTLAFNTGQHALAALAGGAAFVAFGGVNGAPERAASWAGVLAAAVAYTAVNVLLLAAAIRLDSGERMGSTIASLAGAVPLQLLYAGLAVLAAALVKVGPEALAFLVVPALVARGAFRAFQDESEAYDRLVAAILKALEVRDGYTRGHTERVSTLCVEIGRELGLDYGELQALSYAAKLHDVGKLAIPLCILNKPGRLDEEEFARIRTHPEVGAEILAGIRFLAPAIDGVLYHHERVDGKGYPHGIQGDDLPVVARIITACDAFDAMTTTRPYHQAIEVDAALAELDRCAGSQFDPEVVAVLTRVVARLAWAPTRQPYAPPAARPAVAATAR